MDQGRPHVIIFAGPNGAGKSTTGPDLLIELFGSAEFVNADVIAQQLSPVQSQQSDLEAGKIMLRRLRQLADAGKDFAFETTLASRTFAPWIRNLRTANYVFHLVYLWLRTPEMAVERVLERVRMGGHNVPESIIRRRYTSGLRNFFEVYRPLADEWRFYDNSVSGGPRLIAAGAQTADETVNDPQLWEALCRGKAP